MSRFVRNSVKLVISVYFNKFDSLLLCKLVLFRLEYSILESLAVMLALKDPSPTPHPPKKT